MSDFFVTDSNVKRGNFYYGADCPSCKSFMFLYPDTDEGQGHPAEIIGLPIQWVCYFCKKPTVVLPSELRRVQA